MEDAMAKTFQVNNNTAGKQDRQPQQQPGDNRNQQKPPGKAGKAFQVNENSMEDQKPDRSPALPRQDDRGGK
jgi:hypothetical protein